MKISWRRFFQRMAALTFFGGCLAWTSALSYAQSIAWDSGSDPAYADNWQGVSGYSGSTEDPFRYTGSPDNGGFGFQPWHFYYDYNAPGPNGSNRFISNLGGGNVNFAPTNPFSTSYNNLGASAFVLSNQGSSFGGSYAVSVAARGFAAPLVVGQTFRVDIDNPTLPSNPPDPANDDGFIVQFMTGGVFGTERVGMFAQSNFASQSWRLDGASILDSDLTASGATLAVTVTGPDTYDLTFTSLGGPVGDLFSITGATMGNPGAGPIDTIRLQRYGAEQTTNGRNEFYFDNLHIVPEPTLGSMLLVAACGSLLLAGGRKN